MQCQQNQDIILRRWPHNSHHSSTATLQQASAMNYCNTGTSQYGCQAQDSGLWLKIKKIYKNKNYLHSIHTLSSQVTGLQLNNAVLHNGTKTGLYENMNLERFPFSFPAKNSSDVIHLSSHMAFRCYCTPKKTASNRRQILYVLHVKELWTSVHNRIWLSHSAWREWTFFTHSELLTLKIRALSSFKLR